MSTVIVKSQQPEPRHSAFLEGTVRACHLAKEAAAAAGEGIATSSKPRLNSIRLREKELDDLDMEIDSGVSDAITQASVAEARELLACMKFMIGLERIGDLLLSFANSALAAGPRIEPQDTRDLKRAVSVLRADAELDRLRNLIFLRHIENPENLPRQESLQVIFMTQSLERAGDHAKNLAEEVCQVVSGRTVRHVLMSYDKPIEQMFLDWLRQKGEKH